MWTKLASQAVVLIGCLFLVGCDFPQDYTDLMNLPMEKRQAEFRKLPIDKQVDFYLMRIGSSHPPDLSFADDIAVRGEEVIPYLLERLEKEPEDYQKEHIIWIFRQIHVHTFDLRNRQDVISRLEKIVDEMKEMSWKNMSRDRLQFIKEFEPKYVRANPQ